MKGSSFYLAGTIFFALFQPMPSQAEPTLGIFEATGDVGEPKLAGLTVYDSTSQQYTMTGAGSNMWFDRDEHQFAWKRIKGNFIVQAEGKFVTTGGVPHRKFGIIARASLEPGSPQINVVVHGDGRISLQWRPTAGFRMTEDQERVMTMEGAEFFQLERKGDTYIASVAKFGDLLNSEKVADVDLGESPYVGLFVCSHDENESHQVLFRNVRIVIPVKDKFTPYRDFIGSNMELLDPATGDRELIYHSHDNFEAPNWTPDGKSLIYNGRGKLFSFDLASRISSPIDTGSATQLNNDHVLSPDGKVTGISHRAGSDQSVISILPIGGGQPRRVTEKSPSYLHGWSPDSTYLVYTAQRDGDFNIYRIPTEGGDETRLTDTKGLDDGPEYTPDGKYIYFNSARTGRMQIWRMKPDGSDQQQITDDELNNWFAHPSPDGQWIAFLSYLPDVEPTDHPYYKQVYLRLMPASGGKPKVIAYVYGGQGTINVPSWSPDSKKLAFVSNTADE